MFLLRLVKKLTVIGIIGNTQGVSNAENPAKQPNKKIIHQGSSASGILESVPVPSSAFDFADVSAGELGSVVVTAPPF